jgi:alkylhydroperoxidase family enzyme
MAFISYVPEEEAPPELVELYRRYRAGDGVDNIIRIHGHNPPSMEAHVDLYRCLMFGRSPLSRAQREMIAVTVSTLNRCFY